MNNFIKRTWAQINLDFAEDNFNIIKKSLNKQTKIMCVIKADGYGHDSATLANLYQTLGANWFAVSNIEEAIFLRQNKIERPILILGYTPVENIDLLEKYSITQAIYSLDYAQMLSKKASELNIKLNCHIKIDSGMSRIGFACQNLDSSNYNTILNCCNLPNLNISGAFTHFAVSDDGENGYEFTKMQYDSFVKVTNFLKENGVDLQLCHVANSGAIIDYKDFQLDMVRAGIILYGLQPSSLVSDSLKLKPVMCLKSTVALVKELENDSSISYGRTYEGKKGDKIATIPIGYADGYSRALSNGGEVVIHSKRAKIVGRVCMDQLMVDVSHIDNVKIGDEVSLFGNYTDSEFLPVEELAQKIGTINYEVVCDVSKRVPRIFIKDNKVVGVADKICN